MNFKQFCFCLLLLLGFLQCKRKDEVFTSDPNAKLSFSATSINYDTVFSELSYATRRLKVYNTNREALSIDEIALVGGVSSAYKILVNGQSGPVVNGLELMGGDSILIVVDLYFNSQNQSSPYLLEDAIRFRFNGQEQQVLLKAVGRDALIIQPGNLPCAQIWDKNKTIVLLGQTIIPLGCTLTVKKGTQILASVGSSLDVKGTLIVTGDPSEPVYISSIASGKAPGQWLGVRFYEGSMGNDLDWLVVSNAVSGLSFASETSTSLVDIVLKHAIFMDFTAHALDLSNVSLQASNCLFTSSAGNLTRFSKQGTYSFRHCTWAGYSYDYYREGACLRTTSVSGTLAVSVNHAIVWGDKLNEIDLDPSTTMTIDTSVVKTNVSLNGQGQLINQDPKFISPVNRNFQLTSSSPAVNQGQPSVVLDDLKGNSRDLTPDLGCYEIVP